ncbi:MAG: hypothetical protein GT597_13875 [Bacteroidales bacterium]|nr:hypothetical protein [Bacteroidales bacterium]
MPKTIIYGTRREPAADVAKTRTIDFVLSTYTRDSHGTVLNQDGWSLDRYRKNPVVAYQHTLSGGFCMDPNPDYIIGKSVSIGLEGEGREKCLVASVQFEPAEINPLAEKIFQKVLFGSLSRCSVGFIEVGRGKYGEKEEAKGASRETYYFAGQELIEWSIVNVPSNPDTGKRDALLRQVREEAYVALMYAFRELGGSVRLSELEDMTVRQILDMLDGRSPEKVIKLLPPAEVLRQNRIRDLRIKAIKG